MIASSRGARHRSPVPLCGEPQRRSVPAGRNARRRRLGADRVAAAKTENSLVLSPMRAPYIFHNFVTQQHDVKRLEVCNVLKSYTSY
jgi:hypothetical protein